MNVHDNWQEEKRSAYIYRAIAAFEKNPLHQKLFVEANPIPVKWALYRRGLMNDEIRLPLMHLTESHREALAHALHTLQLI